MSDFMDDTPAPGPGHNQPPPDAEWLALLHPAVMRDQLDLDYAHLTKRRDELLAGYQTFLVQIPGAIASDAVEAKVSLFLRQLTTLKAELEQARKVEKQPFDDAAGAVQRWFKSDHLDPIEDAARKVNERLTAYKLKKVEAEKAQRLDELNRAKAQAQRAVQQAATTARPEDKTDATLALERVDQAVRAVATAPAEAARTRTAGASSGLRTTYRVEVVDFAALPDRYKLLNEQLLRAALKDTQHRDADGKPVLDIPGVRVVAEHNTTVRA